MGQGIFDRMQGLNAQMQRLSATGAKHLEDTRRSLMDKQIEDDRKRLSDAVKEVMKREPANVGVIGGVIRSIAAVCIFGVVITLLLSNLNLLHTPAPQPHPIQSSIATAQRRAWCEHALSIYRSQPKVVGQATLDNMRSQGCYSLIAMPRS